MKCKRRGCRKKALEGKNYCGVRCSRLDNLAKFEAIAKKKQGLKMTEKKVEKKIIKEQVCIKRPIQFDGLEYCAHYDPAYYTCVNCMQQAVFKYKPCYKEVK